MEVEFASKTKLPVLISELIGSGVLMIAFNISKSSQNSSDYFKSRDYAFEPINISLVLFILTIMFGKTMGGHFNPAITIAVCLTEGLRRLNKNLGFMVLIIIFQVIGGIMGAMVAYSFLSRYPN